MRPLDDVKIVGFTHIGAGPYALSMLGDMGADVVNVESIEGDGLRARDAAYSQISSYFLAINRSKRSIAVDLKSPGGREVARRLLATADAVLENFRPGALDELGLGYEAVRKIKPDIVYVSITPWGPEGPDRLRVGMDLLAQARGGMLSLNGMPGGPPVRIPPPIADFTATYLACYGLLLGLRARDVHGVGQHIDVSLLAGQVATMANFITYFWKSGKPDRPVGAAHPQLVPYQPFRTADSYLIVACLTERMWQGLCRAIGQPELAIDARFHTNADRVLNRDMLIPILDGALVKRGASEWERALESEGVPAGRIQTLGDLYTDPQVLANEYIVAAEHPVVGEIRVPGIPVRLSATPGRLGPLAAIVGQDTREVLSELGFAPQQIEGMLNAREVGAPSSVT